MVDYKFIAEKHGQLMASWLQFHRCNAWVSEFDLYDRQEGIYFSMVKSYNTIVAIVDHSRRKFVRLGKWSTTTSKQSTMIRNELFPDYEDIQL